jgi:monoterpene epsilon-lactone hydrolase
MSGATKTGDSFYTNEEVEDVLVWRDGFCEVATVIYAKGRPKMRVLDRNVHGLCTILAALITRLG